jgi:hypothetical protein
VKIRSVTANNRRKAFEITTSARKRLTFPYAKLRKPPAPGDRIARVYADPELAREAFTYETESGREESVHLDEVLEYNEDPDHLRELLLYKLTLEATRRVEASDLSKRELIRRLGTSATQFYRLLDPTNTRKSIGQLIKLLHTLDCEVEVVVRDGKAA